MYVINSERTLISLKEAPVKFFFLFSIPIKAFFFYFVGGWGGGALCVFVYVGKLNCEYKEL